MGTVIHKIHIHLGVGASPLPTGKVLHMQQHPANEQMLQVWIEAETDQDLKYTGHRPVCVYPTGGTPAQGAQHLATTVTEGGLVWHLYDMSACQGWGTRGDK